MNAFIQITVATAVVCWSANVTAQADTQTRRVIPGSVALKTAARHGWTVRVRNSLVAGGDCRWNGDNLKASAPAHCWVELFVPPRDDCVRLRQGWEIAEIRLSGTVVEWAQRPADNRPTARFLVRATHSENSLSIDQVVLTGPEHYTKSLERAFNHCNK